MGAIAVFLITLGIGQFIAVQWGLRGASLVGDSRWGGYVLSLSLLLFGMMLLPQSFLVLLWTPLAGVLALLVLLVGGSYIRPMPHPDSLFLPDNPAHGGCKRVDIPDGDNFGPGLLLAPPPSVGSNGAAVCVVPGAGDTKTFFKWQLVQALLAQGFTVLVIDLPGHGDYRHQPLVYPNCLTTILAAIRFLRVQSGVQKVGIVGISLGGAMSIKALAQQEDVTDFVDALAVVATPIRLKFTRSLFYKEVWATYYRSPVVPLLREITTKQAHQSWKSGGYRSKHTTDELFDLLHPTENIERLQQLPMLLVYGHRDSVAPPEHAQAMCRAAPHAKFIESKKASHVMLTLTPKINSQIAIWLKKLLT